MEKAGLTLVRAFRQPSLHPGDGGRLEVVQYALDKSDWHLQDKASAASCPPT
jgi:hypothetical protein